ncbi:MAG TPA: Zn-dependent hydrolase [Acidimicrobiia bacterium]
MSASVHVDGDRLLARLRTLRAIGATPSGGVTREAFGALDIGARTTVQEWLLATGADATVDAATNLVARRPGRADRWIATGSHLDTVIDGGWLDGVYGVVAAVEVLAALRDAEPLRHGVLAVAFANEEGARGTDGMTGSRAVVGQVTSSELQQVDDTGATIAERLAGAGGDPAGLDTARWPLDQIDAFVEVHVEQGPVLESRGHVLGVVPAITGRQALDVVVRGRPNHAGSTPMDLRRDALAAAAEVVLTVEALALDGKVRVATCGHVTVAPNVRNVVPGTALVSVELRDEDPERLAAAVDALGVRLTTIGDRRPVTLDVTPGQLVPPVASAAAVVRAVESVAAASGHGWSSLPSGAGHDAQILGQHVPAGMIFVPSIGGISHAPDEDTADEHLVAGAEALLATVLRLDEELA